MPIKSKKGASGPVESAKIKKTMMEENFVVKHPPNLKPKNKRAK
jgi:hypothetical protein